VSNLLAALLRSGTVNCFPPPGAAHEAALEDSDGLPRSFSLRLYAFPVNHPALDLKVFHFFLGKVPPRGGYFTQRLHSLIRRSPLFFVQHFFFHFRTAMIIDFIPPPPLSVPLIVSRVFGYRDASFPERPYPDFFFGCSLIPPRISLFPSELSDSPLNRPLTFPRPSQPASFLPTFLPLRLALKLSCRGSTPRFFLYGFFSATASIFPLTPGSCFLVFSCDPFD